MRHLPEGVEAFFVSGVPGVEGEDDVRVVQAGDTWIDLPAKVLATARLALTIEGWEWWAKVDDDTFFWGEQALDLLAGVPAEEGVVVKDLPGIKDKSVGFCYFMRREVVQAIVDRHDSGQHKLQETGLEDTEMHYAARAAGWRLYGTNRITFPGDPNASDDKVALLCNATDQLIDIAYNSFNNKQK